MCSSLLDVSLHLDIPLTVSLINRLIFQRCLQENGKDEPSVQSVSELHCSKDALSFSPGSLASVWDLDKETTLLIYCMSKVVWILGSGRSSQKANPSLDRNQCTKWTNRGMKCEGQVRQKNSAYHKPWGWNFKVLAYPSAEKGSLGMAFYISVERWCLVPSVSPRSILFTGMALKHLKWVFSLYFTQDKKKQKSANTPLKFSIQKQKLNWDLKCLLYKNAHCYFLSLKLIFIILN